jgi:site-specific DNA-methyltransferase (adenine-specific)
MVWVKNRVTGFLQSKKKPLRSHEMIYVFYKKSGVYNPQMTLGTPYRINGGTENIKIYKKEPKLQPSILNTGTRYPKSILTYDKPSRSRHTSQKPTDLLENLILQYSNEGDTVLDFCMGSGSTGVACLRTGREFIGIELNTTFYEIARDRLHEEHMLLESL